MKVVLFKKNMAVSSPEKEVDIEGEFEDYYLGKDKVNEILLIKNLPKDFLPLESKRVSITVEDEIFGKYDRSLGSRGQDSSEGLFQNNESCSTYRLMLCRYDHSYI